MRVRVRRDRCLSFLLADEKSTKVGWWDRSKLWRQWSSDAVDAYLWEVINGCWLSHFSCTMMMMVTRLQKVHFILPLFFSVFHFQMLSRKNRRLIRLLLFCFLSLSLSDCVTCSYIYEHLQRSISFQSSSICFAAAVTVLYESYFSTLHRHSPWIDKLYPWLTILVLVNKVTRPIEPKLRSLPIKDKKTSSDSKSLVKRKTASLTNVVCCSNYHENNEGLINRQINLELYASYAYTSMSHHFDRWDVALKGRIAGPSSLSPSHSRLRSSWILQEDGRRREWTCEQVHEVSKHAWWNDCSDGREGEWIVRYSEDQF